MIVSMTGFGRARKNTDQYIITAEVKSVNHRFCEINIRMPRQLMVIEDKIKKAVNKYVHRGRIELFLTIEGEDFVKRGVQVDWDLMDQYYSRLREVKEKFSLEDNITLNHLLNLEQILSIVEEDNDQSQLEDHIIDVVHSAMNQLIKMRESEGRLLYEDLITYLTKVEEHTIQISELAPAVSKHYYERIKKKVSEFIGPDLVDEHKLITDVAIFADKADISEEIVRMKSHIKQFLETLHSKEAIGRKLDFLIQELNRETNTIGSKANNSGIAGLVVEIKSFLEKMKEQVQNVE